MINSFLLCQIVSSHVYETITEFYLFCDNWPCEDRKNFCNIFDSTVFCSIFLCNAIRTCFATEICVLPNF
jgi:hypothetical protein